MTEEDKRSIKPEDDIDFISEDGVEGPPVGPLRTFSSGLMGHPDPVFVPDRSTPLDGGDEGNSLPRFALWSMKYLRHAQLFNSSEVAIQQRFGEGNDVVFVMDDGRKHCLISREVGSGSDGCVYCLVAQITISSYGDLVDGASPSSVFAAGRSFSLCAVFEAVDAVSNISVVESYDTVDELPAEYLPPHPPIEFE